MARDEVVFRVSADEAKAMAAFQRLLDKQQQIDRQTQRGTTRVQQQSNALDKWATNLAKGIAGGAGFATMNQALQTGIGLIQQYDDHLGRITDKMDRFGGSTRRAFAGIQQPGEEGQQFMQRAYTEGARSGLTAEEVERVLVPLQSSSATPEEAMARFGFASLAIQAGVGPEEAMSIERLGIARSMAPGEASNKLVAAAALSGMSEADFAMAAPRTTDFGSWDSSMAAIAALSVSTPEGQLPTTVGAAARVFGPAADRSAFSEQYGLAGMTEPEKIVELWRQAAEDYDPASGVQWDEHLREFARSFGEFLTSNEERLAAQQLVQQGLLFGRALTASRTAGQDLLQDRVDTIMRDDPVIRSAQLSREARATQDLYQIYGPESEMARKRQERMIAAGAQWTESGGGAWVGEGLQPGVIARFIDFIDELNKSQSPLTAGTIRGGAERIEFQRQQTIDPSERVVGALENLRSAVETNTSAMQTSPNRPRNVDQE